MTLKKRKSSTFTVGAAGTATAQSIGLGAVYGKVLGFEFKGDDGNVTTSTTITITDQDGRIVYTGAHDTGTDDSTAKRTNQTFSTVGVFVRVAPVETEVFDQGGTAFSAAEGAAVDGIVAKSPLSVALSSGVSGDTHQVVVWVEV